MAIKKFNAIAGFSVGSDTVLEVIDSSANVSASNLTVSGQSNLGSVSNVKITGGTSGYVLSTDGTGNLSWITNDAGVAGSNTQVQFNNAGAFGASANFTFNSTTNTLSVTNIVANGSGLTSLNGANVTGQVGNALVAGTVYTNAQPNITSVGTLSNLSVSGNSAFSNVSATGISTFSNIQVTGESNLGSIANITITGGSAGYTIVTDGAGNLSWSAASGGAGFVGVTKDDFVANGVQTSFPLSATPTSVEAVQVNINGLIQLETSYTISGSNVVFTTAPLNGQKIEVTTYGVVSIDATEGQIPFILDGALAGNANLKFDTANSLLTVTNISSTGNISAGNLKTDNLQYANGSPYVFTTNAAGSNTQIQFNNNNAFAASANLTFNSTSNTLTTFNIVASNNITVTNGGLNLGNGAIAVSGNQAGIFTSTITDINLGLAANLTIGGTSATTTIRGNLVANVANITNLQINDISSSRASIAVTTGTVVDTFPATKYRSAKYMMRVNSSNGYQTSDVLLIHDSVASYVTIYGSLSTTGSDIVSLSTSIVDGNVLLLATALQPSTTIKIIGTYVAD
jgi:hypothetical protein